MGAVESKVNVDAVKKEANSHPITMFTKEGCSFCTRAKVLLAEEKLDYHDVDLNQYKIDHPKEAAAFVNGLVYMTRQTSVPQVFICGKFVGGFTELNELRNSKKLLEALEQCTGENSLKDY